MEKGRRRKRRRRKREREKGGERERGRKGREGKGNSIIKLVESIIRHADIEKDLGANRGSDREEEGDGSLIVSLAEALPSLSP